MQITKIEHVYGVLFMSELDLREKANLILQSAFLRVASYRPNMYRFEAVFLIGLVVIQIRRLYLKPQDAAIENVIDETIFLYWMGCGFFKLGDEDCEQ
jgi:hypothetical protein